MLCEGLFFYPPQYFYYFWAFMLTNRLFTIFFQDKIIYKWKTSLKNTPTVK